MDKNKKHIEPIAYIHSDFPEKFGIPRQSGLARTQAVIHFAPEYQNPEAVRGLEDFSYIWLIWGFSGNRSAGNSDASAHDSAHDGSVSSENRNHGTKEAASSWKATVRPPRLGGNTRIGVFASRSPFRPNGLGLSSVRLISVTYGKDGPVLSVEGADLMDGTPIYDIKPYIPYADAHPEARGGYTDQVPRETLQVDCSEELLARIPAEKQSGLLDLLAQDPRPSYQNDPERIYGLSYANYSVKFTVNEKTLTVQDIYPLDAS